jgi:glycosyltransferase involved in cell wall biosynthesis
VASLNRVKDPFTLVHALAHLAAQHVPFTVDIVGEDTLDGAVEAQVFDHGLAGRVRFHGFLTQAELRPILSAAHLLVVSSLHEAGPIVALEAALCGVPVAGTCVGHLAEWAPDAAAVVPPGQPIALASAIQEMLTNEEARLRTARNALQRAQAENADHTADRVLALYHELTGP